MSLLRRVPRFLKLSPRASKRLESWSRPLRSVLTDYKAVSKDILKYAKTKPLRFTSILTIGTLSAAAWTKNPDMNGFVDEVVHYSNEISQCSEQTLDPNAQMVIERHILDIANHYLFYINLGIFSVVLRRTYYKECSNFTEICPQLMPEWWTVKERVVDVGVWNKWCLLERAMVDFDVNPEAF